MDCYTRTAILTALARAPAFAGDDDDARRAREDFLTKRVMRAVHTLGTEGRLGPASNEGLMDQENAPYIDMGTN